MSLAEKQQQLLKMKEDLLRSLGLEENNDDFEKVASSAKLALRQGVTKRKADAADAAAAAPRRRSSRCVCDALFVLREKCGKMRLTKID